MPFQTAHYNKGQRVWIVSTTGAMAALCYGKFRGKGRYVKAWVNWEATTKDNPQFQEFEVEDDFYNRVMR